MGKNYYTNNKEFTELLVAYYNDPDSEDGKKRYEQIGAILILLANRVASASNFAGYTSDIKEEMIQDAIYTMIKNLHKYDYEKYNNPFSYFTTMAINVFRHKLNKFKVDLSRNTKLSTLEENGLEYLIADMPYGDLINKNQIKTRTKS